MLNKDNIVCIFRMPNYESLGYLDKIGQIRNLDSLVKREELKYFMEIDMSTSYSVKKEKSEEIKYLYELSYEMYNSFVSDSVNNELDANFNVKEFLIKMLGFLKEQSPEYLLKDLTSNLYHQSLYLSKIFSEGHLEKYLEGREANQSNFRSDMFVKLRYDDVYCFVKFYMGLEKHLNDFYYKFSRNDSYYMLSKREFDTNKKNFKASENHCHVCDKNLYFDTSWYHSDAGYGDDDYGGVTQNVVSAFICPACGKIKREVANGMFGSMENTLMYIFMQNLPVGMTLDRAKELLDNLWNDMSDQRIKLLLERNHLIYDEDKGLIKHSCGHVLLSKIKPNVKYTLFGIIEKELKSKNLNFCPCCGKSISMDTSNLHFTPDKSSLSFEGRSKKTWDRSERR